MDNKNWTAVAEFFFLGFHELGRLRNLLFILILMAYTITVLLDFSIITLVSTRQCLFSPMYFFLKNFLGSEIFVVTLIVPNLLHVIWLEGAPISVPGCIAQSYLYCGSGSTECYLLAAMAYDRYLAICKPLHYNTIMDPRLQYFLVIFCWVFGFLLTVITLSLLVELKFCNRNIIDHYFCDLVPLMDLACSDIYALQMEILVLSIPILLIPFVFVLVSYACVFITILGMSSITGRKKAFSTCSSHLSVVGIFFGTLIVNYLIPVNGHPVAINKMISLIYTVVTPLFSPIIYSIRNQNMRDVIKTLFNFCKKI
uniref:Olfactory receptor n=1 Tax=Pyxicephalus adspersus TaxID=30357 RepID=A0AAV3AZK7_PYXAD|nr:TPA: hypothetical protein GDO54_005867 [Pyxicephalus adspersus]